MTSGMCMSTVIYPVKDLAQAKTLYGRLLGVEPDMDEPYYVGFSVEGQHIGLDPHGHSKGMPGPVGYWHVDDIEASVKLLLDAGAQVQEAVSDVGGGKLVASTRHWSPDPPAAPTARPAAGCPPTRPTSWCPTSPAARSCARRTPGRAADQ